MRCQIGTKQTVAKYAIGAAVAAALALPVATGHAQTVDPNSAPQSFRLDEGWAKLPEGRKWGAAFGVEIDRDGKSVWVFDRCARRRLLRLQPRADPEVRCSAASW